MMPPPIPDIYRIFYLTTTAKTCYALSISSKLSSKLTTERKYLAVTQRRLTLRWEMSSLTYEQRGYTLFEEQVRKRQILVSYIYPDYSPTGDKEVWYDGEAQLICHGDLIEKWQINGMMSYRCSFRNGLKHGFEYYWNQGNLLEEMPWKDGSKHGRYRRWNQGKVVREEYWRQGYRDGFSIEPILYPDPNYTYNINFYTDGEHYTTTNVDQISEPSGMT